MTQPEKKLVLCIDDNPISLYTRQLILAGSGYRVVAAENGKEGLRLAESLRPNAVILDYYLPDINGPAVAAAIKKINRETPILVFSGDSQVPDDLTDYADGFLTKDCGPTVLLNEVARLLRQSNSRFAKPHRERSQ